MKFPWWKHKHHRHDYFGEYHDEPECEEMATNTSASLAKAQAMQQANLWPSAGVSYPGQPQLPFGQPMYTNINGSYPQTSPLKSIAIELDNIVVKKVRNGYVLHVHDSHGEPKVYVCGDADDVGEALKVALVNIRIDAVK